jgi:membrane-bound lytic murein transglycosylase D
MARYFLLVVLPALLLLSGCAAHKNDNADMQANLEPELWDTSQILKNLQRGRPLTEQEKKALASRGSIQFNLDVKDNEEVQMFLQYFSIDKRGSMDKWLQRAEPYLPYVRAVLASYNLPPDLIALPFIESGYSNAAYSPVGAGGMWQFMPYTARRFGLTVDWWVDERRDPYKATVAAAKYLTKLYQMFGDWHLALAAYNAGEGKISRVMAASGQCDFFDIAKDPKLLKEETRHYVPKFLAVLKIFQNLDTLGFKKVNWQAGPNLKEVGVPGGTDLSAMAQACGLSWEQFREYNPGFRRQVSPPDTTVNVYVPVAKEQTALAFLNNPGNYPAAGYQNVVAQPGDTWWNLARKTGMPVAELRQLNNALPETLPPGQTVRVAQSASASESSSLAEGPDACAPKPLVAAKPQRHRVNKGESIGSISRKYGVSPKEIMAANKMKHEGRLTLGTSLIIPGGQAPAAPPAPSQVASGKPVPYTPQTSISGKSPIQSVPAGAMPQAADATHSVQRGETVGSIAARYGVSPAELMAANNMRSGKDLLAGKSIVIPGKGGKKAPEKPHPGDKRSLPEPVKTPEPTAKAVAGREPAPAAKTPTPLAQANKSAPAPLQQVAVSSPTTKPQALAGAPAPKPAGKAVNYKVGPGETVWGIAKKFNVEPSSLMAWNNMKSAGALQAGTQLTIHKD